MYGRFSIVYDQLMQDVDYDGWTGYLDRLLKANGILPKARILECAAGTGEITWRLVERGYQVTASDASVEMLEIARAKLLKRGIRVPLVQQTMQELSVHRPADAVIAACDGVNYLLAEEELKAFFQAVHRALKPNGILLFDLSSAYKLEHTLGMNTFGEDGKDVAYLWKNMYDNKSRLLEMNLTFFIRKGALYERFEERQLQRVYTMEEIQTALVENGFSVIGAYEAFGFGAAGETAERIQFAARKEA